MVNVLLAISVLRPKRTKDTFSSKDQKRNPPRPNRHGLGKTLIEAVGNYRLCREFCDVLRIVRCLGGLCRLRLVLGM